MGAIENKYKVIDKAIKNYKEQIRYFNNIIGRPEFRMFIPGRENDWNIGGLKTHLRYANQYIEQGLDAIRITKRYFKNISNTFQSNTDFQKSKKSLEIRKAIMETKTIS
jgi:prolyl-tRNA synthetase